MIEKPDIPDSVLADGLRDGWGLLVEELAFMPVGLDGAAWAYEVRLVGGGRRFLKVRTDEFTRPARTLPSFLFDHGLPQVVAPIGGVRAIGGLRLALYPFVDGPSLWSRV